MDTLFPDTPDQHVKNPCVRKFGAGPVGVTCKACARLIHIHWRTGRNFYKCELRGDSRGAATDHRLSWPACAHFIAARDIPIRQE